MKVLVTGATGFIGKALVKANKFDYRCVVRDKKNNNFDDTFVINDLNENTDYTGAFEGVDIVIHLAGLAHSNQYNAKAYDEVNYKGTLNLARQAQRASVKKFIFISTALVNGQNDSDQLTNEEYISTTFNDFTKSKYMAEKDLLALSKEGNIKVVIIRPALVYGPYVKANFLALISLVKKLPVLPFGRASNRRSFVSIYNLIDFIETCITNKKADGELFFLSDDETISTKVLTNRMAKAFDKKLLQLPIPVIAFRCLGVVIGKKRKVDQLFGDFIIDCSKACNLLEWQPKVTMEETLKAFIKEGYN